MCPEVTPLCYDVKQTIVLMGLSKATIHRFIKNKKLVSRKIGHKRMILRSSIDAFLKKDHESPPQRNLDEPSPRAKEKKTRGAR